eukprot:50931_1
MYSVRSTSKITKHFYCFLLLISACIIIYYSELYSSVDSISSHDTYAPIIIQQEPDISAPILDIYATNISYSVPTLWIFGPAKTCTGSVWIGLKQSFPNWQHPEPGYHEYPEIWSAFLPNHYFGSDKNPHYHIILTDYLDHIQPQSLDEYPFHDILLLLEPRIIQRQMTQQQSTFANIINATKYDENMMVVVKTPQHYYSPFIPIIFAYHLSPTNYIQNQQGTKVLIILRNTVQRTISWYSLFHTKRFVAAFNDTSTVFELIQHQINVALNYKPLDAIRHRIVNRTTEADDVMILNEYFKFFYGFSRLFTDCTRQKGPKIHEECKEIINSGFFTGIKYLHTNYVRHPIHMLFVGLMYPHLLLPLVVFKQQKMLGTKFRFVVLDYLIQHPKDALYLMTCWSANTVCDVDEFKQNSADIWEKINLPHVGHESLPVPNDVKTLLTRYYAPVTQQVNDMLNRFNANDDIFLGEWNPDSMKK